MDSFVISDSLIEVENSSELVTSAVIQSIYNFRASSHIKVKKRVKINSILFEIDFSSNIFFLFSYLACFS